MEKCSQSLSCTNLPYFILLLYKSRDHNNCKIIIKIILIKLIILIIILFYGAYNCDIVHTIVTLSLVLYTFRTLIDL